MTSSVAKDARNSIFRLKVTDLLITIIEKHFPGTISKAGFFILFPPSLPLSLPFVVNSSFLCKCFVVLFLEKLTLSCIFRIGIEKSVY